MMAPAVLEAPRALTVLAEMLEPQVTAIALLIRPLVEALSASGEGSPRSLLPLGHNQARL